MNIVTFSARTMTVSALLITGFSITAQAGYKDNPCNNCDAPLVERHVDVNVIHRPRPRMIYIPEGRSRQRVHMHYKHYHPQAGQSNIRIIDRRLPLTKSYNENVVASVPLPEVRPLSAIREGIHSGLSRILGRR